MRGGRGRIQGPCACCARAKRRCKLTSVLFPCPSSDDVPPWLPWTAAEWVRHRHTWYEQIDKLLNIQSYLRCFFRTDERLAAAQQAVAEENVASVASSTRPSSSTAAGWLRRVEQWKEKLGETRDPYGIYVLRSGHCSSSKLHSVFYPVAILGIVGDPKARAFASSLKYTCAVIQPNNGAVL